MGGGGGGSSGVGGDGAGGGGGGGGMPVGDPHRRPPDRTERGVGIPARVGRVVAGQEL